MTIKVVVDLPMAGGLPIVPGAYLTKREGDSGYYSVHIGEPDDKAWIILYRVGPGKFLAMPNKPRLRNRLPEDGVPWHTWRKRAARRRAWRHWRVTGTDADGAVSGRVMRMSADVPDADPTSETPWTVDGVTITSARPTLPSVCAQRRNFLRDEIEADE